MLAAAPGARCTSRSTCCRCATRCSWRASSTLASVAPGRVVLGVGVGGEDRHEVEITGVDPRRCPRRRVAGRAARPAHRRAGHAARGASSTSPARSSVPPPTPGAVRRGRPVRCGAAAIGHARRRLARHLGVAGALRRCDRHRGGGATPAAPTGGRSAPSTCGAGSRPTRPARAVVGAMEALYGVPYERFERWSPAGTGRCRCPPRRSSPPLASSTSSPPLPTPSTRSRRQGVRRLLLDRL